MLKIYFRTRWKHQAIHVNSLWPSDAIWWQRFGSTLALIMAWRHQAITWTTIDLSSVRSWGIHSRALSCEDLKIPISKTRLKITFLELHSDLPGANEFKHAKYIFEPGRMINLSMLSISEHAENIQSQISWHMFINILSCSVYIMQLAAQPQRV